MIASQPEVSWCFGTQLCCRSAVPQVRMLVRQVEEIVGRKIKVEDWEKLD
jgi:hypothetical protein